MNQTLAEATKNDLRLIATVLQAALTEMSNVRRTISEAKNLVDQLQTKLSAVIDAEKQEWLRQS